MGSNHNRQKLGLGCLVSSLWSCDNMDAKPRCIPYPRLHTGFFMGILKSKGIQCEVVKGSNKQELSVSVFSFGSVNVAFLLFQWSKWA